MRRWSGVLAGLVVLLASAAPAGAQANEEAAVRAAIQAYFDGITKFDAAALQRAFHPEAMILAQSARGTYRSPFSEWSRFVERGSAPENPEAYRNRILSIDVAGNAAVVKTDLEWPTVHYVDYLSLLKVEGEWRIVNKIFWSEPRS